MFKVNNNKIESSLEIDRQENILIDIIAKDNNNTYNIAFWIVENVQTLLNFQLNKDISMNNYLNINDIEIGINNSYSLNGLDYGNIIFRRIDSNKFKVFITFNDYFDIGTNSIYNFEIEELLFLE